MDVRRISLWMIDEKATKIMKQHQDQDDGAAEGLGGGEGLSFS